MLRQVRAALPLLLVVIGCGDDAPDDDGASGSTSRGPTTHESGSTESTLGPSEGTTGSSTTGGDEDEASMTSSTSADETTGTTGEVPTAAVTIVPRGNALLRVDLATGAATEICTLPASASYESITFDGTDTLFAHNVAHNRIETINPCNCGFQIAGLTGTGSLAITTDGAEGLLGLDLGLDALTRVNPQTGLSTVVGPLGLPITTAGIAWDFDLGVPLLLDVTTNALHTIDVTTGTATQLATLSQSLSAAGTSMLAATGELFVCAADTLHRIDPASGTVTTVGSLGSTSACHNLAVPAAAIACLQ